LPGSPCRRTRSSFPLHASEGSVDQGAMTSCRVEGGQVTGQAADKTPLFGGNRTFGDTPTGIPAIRPHPRSNSPFTETFQ